MKILDFYAIVTDIGGAYKSKKRLSKQFRPVSHSINLF